LLLESVESIAETRYPACHRFKRVDLFVDDCFEHNNYLGLSWRGQSVIVMAEKGIKDIKILLEDCQYRTYLLDGEQAKRLMVNIEQEQRTPPKYKLTGNSSKGHNCLTWGEAMLDKVGCNVREQTSWLDFIAAQPDRQGLRDYNQIAEKEEMSTGRKSGMGRISRRGVIF